MSTIIFDPLMFDSLKQWVETDPAIQPANIRVHELTIDTGDGTVYQAGYDVMSQSHLKAIHVNQGDETIFIDEEGSLWEYPEGDSDGLCKLS